MHYPDRHIYLVLLFAFLSVTAYCQSKRDTTDTLGMVIDGKWPPDSLKREDSIAIQEYGIRCYSNFCGCGYSDLFRPIREAPTIKRRDEHTLPAKKENQPI